MKDQLIITAHMPHFFVGQFQHLLLLAALLSGVVALGYPTLDGNPRPLGRRYDMGALESTCNNLLLPQVLRN